MKKVTFLALIFFGFSVNLLAQKAPEKGLKQISETSVKEYIDYLASDKMRGRSAPSYELNKSADYIADKFKNFGVKPINNSYFQKVPFCAADIIPEKTTFQLLKSSKKYEFELKENFTPLFNSASNRAKGELVFAGYGITAPEYNYDDYKDIDVKDKVVLILTAEPRQNDTTSTVFEGTKSTKHSALDEAKIRNAAQHGAAGVLLVTDPLYNLAITARGHLWSSLYMKGMPPMYTVCNDKEEYIPAAQINREVVNQLFGSVDSLKTLQKDIDDNLRPNSFIIPETTVDLSVAIDKNFFPSRNIVGWIKGSDPELKNEFVIIGAHYDHIGVSPRPNNENDSIMNGADDNASGTAAVMAVANAFAAGKKPARSVVFLLFTAEERGLVGSQFYTDNPLFPLDKTVAMINMDMVGRNGTDSVYVVGKQYNPDLAKLVNAEIPKNGLKEVEMQMDLYQSSDYYPFYKKGISAIGLTSGLHKDYHQVSDNPDKINHTKVRKISQLVYNVAWQIANSTEYYTIINK